MSPWEFEAKSGRRLGEFEGEENRGGCECVEGLFEEVYTPEN